MAITKKTIKVKKPVWQKIPDSHVRHVWECSTCDNLERVSPDFYSDAGTPFCPDCQCNMDYCYTELLKS